MKFIGEKGRKKIKLVVHMLIKFLRYYLHALLKICEGMCLKSAPVILKI